MKEIFKLIAALALLASCAAPPDRPGSLWDSLPSSESDAAKTVPSKTWNEPAAAPDTSTGPAPEAAAVSVLGSVVLNEIFYDSADSDTDGNLFVEFYGTANLPIGGCKINFVNGADGGVYDSIAIPVGETLRDDGFYVVADAKTGAPTVSNVPGADLVDNFDPQNGPDAVQLVDATGQLVDAVGYGDGILSLAENGLSSFEGTSAPDVANGHSLERKQAGLDSDNNAADFSDLGEPTPGSGPAVPQSPPETIPTALYDPLPPVEDKVVLNEVFYDAVGSDTDGVLFVELFGTEGMAVGGYKIDFVDGADGSVDDFVVLPEGARLRPDGFYVVADAKNGSVFETYVAGADFVDNFDPANGPDAVRLLDGQGSFLDAVGYGEGSPGEGAPALDVFNSHSLERHEAGLDTDDNGADFEDRETPTPGW
jgi:hypothetical protein